MTREEILMHLKILHESETHLNRDMTKIDKQIVVLKRKKAKIQKLISRNMLNRNILIDQL